MNVRFAGYLFKRSNRPYNDSTSYDDGGGFPVSDDDRLKVMDDTGFQSNRTQSLNKQNVEHANHVGLVESKRNYGDESNNHHPSIGEVEPLLSSLPFVPILPDLQVPGTIKSRANGNTNENRNATENAIDLLSAFLGESNLHRRYSQKSIFRSPNEKNNQSIPVATKASSPFLQPTIAKKRDRTLPISIADASATSSSCCDEATEKLNLPLHLQKNISSRNGSDYDYDRNHPAPQSYIDPKDGHVWRAKYCVLVDGALYFYSNSAIGNSVEAQLERERMSLSSKSFDSERDNHEVDHLGKSPMPRNLHPMLSSKEKSGGGSFCLDPNVYWEKRVALSMVGAVRSSPDFGEKAFELIAMSSGEDSDGDGEVDRLILRANDSQDVNSWIFEIHKSFMDLMKHFAAVVGSNEACNSEQNILSKSYNVPPAHMFHRFRSTSGRTNNTVAPSSPLLLPLGNTMNKMQITPLSDTYVRVRRRNSLGNSSVNVSSSLIHSPVQIHSPSNRLRSGSDDIANMIMNSKSFPLNKIPSSRSSTRLNIADASNKESRDLMKSTAITTIEKSPTAKSGKYIPPHLRNQATITKYVPTHAIQGEQKARDISINSVVGTNAEQNQKKGAAIVDELLEQIKSEDKEVELIFDDDQSPNDSEDDSEASSSSEDKIRDGQVNAVMKLGGCADPCLVKDSICHEMFIPLGASKVTVDYHAYGYFGELCEIGAVSKCGIRDYNEDAYLILNDLLRTRPEDDIEPFDPKESYFSRFEQHGLFAIFDGHCGNQAARYAAEKFHSILLEESLSVDLDGNDSDMKTILSHILMESVTRLDHEFCVFSKHGGRDWFAGSTAIIVLVVDKQIVVASVGDASGVISASTNNTDRALRRGWSILEEEDFELNKIGGSCKGIIYKEMNESHCPSRPEEKERIIAANGWVTHETEIPMIAQFHRMDWGDRDVLDIFQRCFSDRLDTAKPARILNIYRVCGDLAVSRAIGDREYKAAFNKNPSDSLAGNAWKSPAPMPYMTYKDIHNEEHSGLFEGDLVISTPEIKFFELGSLGTDELILLACDGLWDVIDPDDAVRVTRNLLFGVELGAKETAVRLAQLAKGLGSSDNITVIVVKFHNKVNA